MIKSTKTGFSASAVTSPGKAKFDLSNKIRWEITEKDKRLQERTRLKFSAATIELLCASFAMMAGKLRLQSDSSLDDEPKLLVLFAGVICLAGTVWHSVTPYFGQYV